MNKTLITGGAGFVGRALLNEMSVEERDRAVVVDFDEKRTVDTSGIFGVVVEIDDISSPDVLNQLVVKHGINQIIHLAANSDIRAGQASASPDFDNTLKTSLAVAEIINIHKISKVLFASSSAIFGEQKDPISSDRVVLRNPASNYGWAKLASEHALTATAKRNDTQLVITRFPNVIGGEPTHGVLFDLKNKLVRNPNELEVLGDGTQSKPYMHVQDLAKILHRLFKSGETRTVNIGPGDNISVAEIVDIILQVSQLNPIIKWGESPHGWVGDVAKYEFEDTLPSDCEDIKVRNSRQSVIDSFTTWWRTA